MFRSQVIREVETDLAQARARGMIRTPKFAGLTYADVRAKKYRRSQRYKVAGYALAVLAAMGLAVGMVLL